jgi:2,4-dienoyl-CoA reductase-like NADH-dependent reductase (Old Yellow Enzyme family)
MTHDGLVSDELVQYHRAPAAGGAAMTTVAYCAVSSEGRTYRHQLWMRQEAMSGLRRLTDAVHAEGAAAAIQLGHAGWFANPKATREPSIGPSRVFSPYGLCFPRAMDHDDLVRVRTSFAEAAVRAVDAGFDGLELHLGHGYLLSQFLSPYTNRRRDEYGGGIENRARFPREVCLAVRDAVGDRAAVWAKLNMDDGFRHGLTAAEGIEVARMLEVDGALDALQLTGGFTARSPMFLMRGDVPLKELIELERDPIRRLGMRVVAPTLMKAWEFDEAFFLPLARGVRAAVTMPLMLLGGVTRYQTAASALAEGFALVGMARALLIEPDLPRRWEQGDRGPSPCTHCNQCVVEMDRDGTRCVLR